MEEGKDVEEGEDVEEGKDVEEVEEVEEVGIWLVADDFFANQSQEKMFKSKTI